MVTRTTMVPSPHGSLSPVRQCTPALPPLLTTKGLQLGKVAFQLGLVSEVLETGIIARQLGDTGPPRLNRSSVGVILCDGFGVGHRSCLIACEAVGGGVEGEWEL